MNPTLLTPILLCWFLPFLIGASAAQGGKPGSASSGSTSQGFVLQAGSHDITTVVDAAAKFLGRNLILQPQELAGRPESSITLQKSLNLDVRGCEEVVSQLAWLSGLVMSPVDPERGIWEFINLRGQRRGEIQPTFMAPDQIVKRPTLKIVVSTSLHLKYIDAMRASQYLRPMLASQSGRGGIPVAIGSLGSRHALMLQGMADEVANAIKMVTMMDTEDANDAQPDFDARLASLEKQRAQLTNELDALRARVKALESGK